MELNISKLKAKGIKDILDVQSFFAERIRNAPKKSTYNKFTGGYTQSAYDLRKMKFDAIKDICQDLAVFGIQLLSDESLAEMKPKTPSILDDTKDLIT